MADMGRTPKIQQEHIDYISEYLDECYDDWEVLEKSSSSGEKSSSETVENKLKVNLPTYAGLILFYVKKDKKLKIHKSTLIDWSKKGKEEGAEQIYIDFSDSLDNLLLTQEQMLVNGSISQRYSGVVGKLMLSSNHGYTETEKKEVKHSGEINLGEFFDGEKKDTLVKK